MGDSVKKLWPIILGPAAPIGFAIQHQRDKASKSRSKDHAAANAAGLLANQKLAQGVEADNEVRKRRQQSREASLLTPETLATPSALLGGQ